MKNKAKALFLANEKNKRTIDKITLLLNEESAIAIGERYNMTRAAVYKIKDKYLGDEE